MVGAVCVAFVAGVRSSGGAESAAQRRTWTLRAAVGSAAALGLTAAVISSGALRILEPVPLVILYFAGSNLFAIALALSPVGKRLAGGLSLALLLGFQGFRVPLEVVLHSWYSQGSLPVQMTWEGQNLDIISGLLGLGYALLAARSTLPRSAAWAANSVGLLLLLNVMRIAVTSGPLPMLRTFMNHPPLLLVCYLPYGWIVPFCVSAALFAHLMTVRKLLDR